jgi:hypothetical protein
MRKQIKQLPTAALASPQDRATSFRCAESGGHDGC